MAEMALLCWMIALTVVWLLLAGVPAYVDARCLKASHDRALRLALSAAFRPLAYWCHERVRLLSHEEQARLRALCAGRLGLEHVSNLRCPLCGAEIQRAWVLDTSGRLAVRKGPLLCPTCDFRLDSCRHCAHFKEQNGMMGRPDPSQGHCAFYKTVQPIEGLCSPEVAKQLQQRGYTHLSGPTRVTDSYVPLQGCSAFLLDERRLRTSGARPPARRCRALLGRLGNRAESLAGGNDWLTL